MNARRTAALLTALGACIVADACRTGGAAVPAAEPVPDAAVPQRRELLRTTEFAVYLLDLAPGDSTPMHRHDRDIVTVFTSNSRTRSTFWGQSPRLDRPPFGAVRFRTTGFTHTVANIDTSNFQAVIVAFSRGQGRPDSSARTRSGGCGVAACDAGVREAALFCVVDACIDDVTIDPGATWPTGEGAVMLAYVTPATLSATGESSGITRRTRKASAVDADSAGAFRAWRNDGATPVRLIAFFRRGTSKHDR